jgi:hypothetical protein
MKKLPPAGGAVATFSRARAPRARDGRGAGLLAERYATSAPLQPFTGVFVSCDHHCTS